MSAPDLVSELEELAMVRDDPNLAFAAVILRRTPENCQARALALADGIKTLRGHIESNEHFRTWEDRCPLRHAMLGRSVATVGHLLSMLGAELERVSQACEAAGQRWE